MGNNVLQLALSEDDVLDFFAKASIQVLVLAPQSDIRENITSIKIRNVCELVTRSLSFTFYLHQFSCMYDIRYGSLLSHYDEIKY